MFSLVHGVLLLDLLHKVDHEIVPLLRHLDGRRGLHHVLEAEQLFVEVTDGTTCVGLGLRLVLLVSHVQLGLLCGVVQRAVFVATVCSTAHDA